MRNYKEERYLCFRVVIAIIEMQQNTTDIRTNINKVIPYDYQQTTK